MTNIRIVDLEKRFGDVKALADVNVSVGKGEFFTLLGPSGCGKTTLLRIIAGFYRQEKGEVWLGSAFVVDDTYVSGYEPLTNVRGQRIGMLYVGFLEAPLQKALYKALTGLCLLFLLVSSLGTLTTLRWARTIFRPLERMNRVMADIEAGKESARVGPTASRDELGRLSRAFDHLLDS